MQTIQQLLATINAFVEDTCVVFAFAYFLSRAKFIQELATQKDQLLAGILLGLIGSSEVVFSTMRAPYMTHSLVVCLAILLGGWTVALPTILVPVVLAAVVHSPGAAAQDAVFLLLVGECMSLLRKLIPTIGRPFSACLGGTLSQGAGLLIFRSCAHFLHLAHPITLWPGSVLANGFGLGLVTLVFRDSEIRGRSEKHRLEAEHLKTLLVSADLAALRARVHPHFLFNTLTSIASLCGLDPQRAEASVVKLSKMMRRTLEVDPSSFIRLADEIDYIRSYMDIQDLRFGCRITATIDVDPRGLGTHLPAFALQTLVENAYRHGLSNCSGQGEVAVVGHYKEGPKRVVLAIKDNGIGMDTRNRPNRSTEAPRHGLDIVDRQLRLLFGERARLRIFSRPGKGTLVAFQVPTAPS